MNSRRRTRTEDYLAAIEQVCANADHGRASTGEIARLTGVSKGTASNMLKELADDGLVNHVLYDGAVLTQAGRERVAVIQRRLRLIELLLNRLFGIQGSDVIHEAWLVEPGVSDKLIQLIDDYLNRPSTDICGRSIPDHNDRSSDESDR